MNRLAGEASPYLRQHRENPVDWYPWGPEAFAEAKRRDVPILLSIGYSACHWCHVMAHESFEDVDVAHQMNECFVCIKVDREERPDVDAIYMDAVQALTGHGGWPMTVFLTPSAEPFFGGTYYPREGFLRLMSAISDIWITRRDEVMSNVGALVEAIGRTATVEPSSGLPDREFLERAARFMVERHDAEWGGFGDAPKFPSTMNLDFLLRCHQIDPDAGYGAVVERSLDAMASGGIHDQLGGGFARYSVDRQWLVPHFEKMLYDQALLLRAFCHGFQVLGHSRWSDVVESTIEYLVRDMRHHSGGFYSAEDADSIDDEGHSHEGWFYTWTVDEVRSILGSESAEFEDWFGMSAAGNFEGRNILRRPIAPVSTDRSRTLEESCRSLLEVRASRTRPGLDDKIILEWNAMLASSLAECGMAMNRSDWIQLAVDAVEFIFQNLRAPDGSWCRVWQADAVPPARHAALSVDMAFLIDACVRINEATGRRLWIDRACQVADTLLDEFLDRRNGGFFTVASGTEQLVVRQKDLLDNATPSANSTAAHALSRLSALTGRSEYSDVASETMRLLSRIAAQAPTAAGLTLLAIDFHLSGATEVALVGESSAFRETLRSTWRPTTVVAWGEPFGGPMWESRRDGWAYVCRDHVCSEPTADPERFGELLSRSGG